MKLHAIHRALTLRLFRILCCKVPTEVARSQTRVVRVCLTTADGAMCCSAVDGKRGRAVRCS